MNMARLSRAIIALIFVAALTAALIPVINDVLNRHVLSVRVAGNFEHVSRLEFEAVVREQLMSASFFAVDVESLRRAAMSIPWVRDVTVRRVWPDSVHIAVVERVAIARWNDDAVMESDASIFRPREGVEPYGLVRLVGPVDQQAQVLAQFKRLSAGLAAIGGGVVGLSLSERGQWEVTFSNGMTIVPSTPFDASELMAFSQTLPSIFGADMERVARIDMRYANGFAVRWRDAAAGAGAHVKEDDELRSQGEKG